MTKPGYIKLWRKTLDSVVHSDAIVLAVFASLLMRATWKPSWFQLRRLDPGDVAFSQADLGKSLKLSRRQIQRALEVLETHGIVKRRKRCNSFTHLSICNWQVYQSDENLGGATDVQQTCNGGATAVQQTCTLEEGKEGKKVKKVRSGGRFTPPTHAEVAAYCEQRRNGIDAERFIDYYEARGWFLGKGQKMKDWKSAVRTWEGNQTAKQNQDPFERIR